MSKVLSYLASIPHDKLLHSFYGTLIYAIISIFNPLVAIIAVFAIATIKEIYDQFRENGTGFNIPDLIFTVLIPSLLFIISIL